jgi:glutathione S-transferase
VLALYQFPISHYCEKIRWALDYKQLEHKVKNLLPGFHALKTTKIASRSSVPVLVHDDNVIQGSDKIITYLDEHFPERSLTPKEAQLKDEALKWEKYVDEEIGIHVRRCCYHILLEYPDIVISFFTHKGPWYGKYILPYMFPKMKIKMRDKMKINEEEVKVSRQHLGKAIDRLHNHLQENKFLAGDKFSRADLAAASLLAPLCMPDKYGLNWPEQYPTELQDLIDEFKGKMDWVDAIYSDYR